MATQAKETKTRRADLKSRSADLGQVVLWIWNSAMCGFGKLANGHATFQKNPQMVMTVKLMVKIENLFRLKDGLRPCLEDANIK